MMKQAKRRLFWTITTICLSTTLFACASTKKEEEPYTIVFASDIHFVSPRIHDDGAAFHKAVDEGDAKVLYVIEELTDAFVEEIIDLHPNALVLGGDLTMSGEKESHEDFCEKLKPIEDADIDVFTVSGNHDLDQYLAAVFHGDTYDIIPNITSEEYRALYEPYGFDFATSIDELSGSYYAPLNTELGLLVIDTNLAKANLIPEDTFSWIKEVLETARKNHISIISVSHQNLYTHLPMFGFGYQINNGSKLSTLFHDYQDVILLHLSGHMHIQHIVDEEIPEIATSALSVTPNQYGILTITKDAVDYQTKSVDVSTWAKNHNLEDERLLNFEDYSKQWFERNLGASRRSYLETIEELSDEQVYQMVRFLVDTNEALFAGDVRHLEDYEEVVSLWRTYWPNFYNYYIEPTYSRWQDQTEDFHHFHIER